MTILFADQFSELGGAQFVLRDLLTETQRRGWHAELAMPGNGPLFGFCRDNGIPTHRLAPGRGVNGLDIVRSARMLQAIVLRNRIDLVVANGPRVLPAVVGVGCPVVFHLHSRPNQWYSRMILRASLWAGNAQVVCVSRFVAETIPGSSPRIVYNGVRDQGFRARQFGNHPPRIGIVGRIAPQKGHRDFVQAAKLVARTLPNVRFTVDGASLFIDPRFERDLRLLATDSPVEFHGWTDDVTQVLHELDILVLPSNNDEATPRVVMEALSAGTPVIAYPSGGIPELIRHGETGLLTDRSDYQSLARSIEALLSDPGLMARLAANGRRDWEARFQIDRFHDEICELFERAAKKSGKPYAAPAVACKDDLA